ncbi:uncharacterized protein KY384_003627 [Bacidia gigantensis]|uniref:uncharacterized protein n=1 Tax=Bacidia gigantensis TaxID=2732470 RepID=UPI001D04C4EC|nr:uncharacterized protein KY384_003627 [Bacidia gigantensis]KAG8531991.1 hypothetical protein KY384_003627 [Bacidia gigantensis]
MPATETMGTRSKSKIISESGYEIKLPASIYTLNGTKPRGLAHIEELLDSVGPIIEGLKLIENNAKIMECECLLSKLEEAISTYSGELNALSQWNTDRQRVDRAADEHWQRVAALLSPHLKLKRELRLHIKIIENVLEKQGEHLDVLKHLSGDVGILNNLGATLSSVLGNFIGGGGDDQEFQCFACGKGCASDDDEMLTDKDDSSPSTSGNNVANNEGEQEKPGTPATDANASSSKIVTLKLQQRSVSSEGEAGLPTDQTGWIHSETVDEMQTKLTNGKPIPPKPRQPSLRRIKGSMSLNLSIPRSASVLRATSISRQELPE